MILGLKEDGMKSSVGENHLGPSLMVARSATKAGKCFDRKIRKSVSIPSFNQIFGPILSGFGWV